MSAEEYALSHGLKKVGARPSLLKYVREAITRIHFAYTLASYGNEASNAKSRLGSWWNILLPTIQAATYGLIFGLILGASKPDNFLPFLFTGVFLFSYVQGSFTNGAGSIVNRSGLVRSLSFPRVLMPLSVVLAQTIALFPQLLVLAVILVAVQGFASITLGWLMLIPLIALMFVFNFGVAMIMARVTVHVQDLNKLVPFITRIMFYVSGVFFSLEKIFTANPDNIWAKLIQFNPIFDFLNLARGYLVQGYQVRPEEWISVIIWSFSLAVLGLIFFWSAEERYGRED
ncbi:MAG: ABC transporter permease [Rhodoluna sp.]|nr:ABC transporter permease [Rhodoluna sp.]